MARGIPMPEHGTPPTQIEILAMDAETLELEVQRHDALYHEHNQPEIPDTLFDLMVERLRQLRPDSPALLRIGGLDPDASHDNAASPDDAEQLHTGDKVRHSVPMLSLEKCYSEQELLRFFERIEDDAVATPKVDGVALMIRYDHQGRLLLGATRGDGRVGEVITENIRRVQGIPHHIDTPGLEVRGEAYLPLSTFRQRFAEQFANPRNLTAGSLKQKDPQRTAEVGLRFIAYDVLGSDEKTETDKAALLERIGFTPAPGSRCTAAEGQALFDRLSTERASLDYETDGIVYKAHTVARHAVLGTTAHHPRWAIAYKYQGESGITRFADIEWSVSRTGAINPVAIVDPVSLSGVTVQRISLHNLGIIEKLAGQPLTIGDNDAYPLSSGARLLVTRRGGVIPHVEELMEPGSNTFNIPTTCPSCGAPTERREDLLMADHREDCATTGQRRLRHFADVIDAEGFGPKLLAQLYDNNLATEPADLYRLNRTDLISLERMGEKSADNLLAAIEARRTLPLDTFLAALGIPGLGRTLARTLASRFRTWEHLRNASREELIAIDGIAEVLADGLRQGFEDLTPVIDNLLGVVQLTEVEQESPASGPLDGQSFLFTGTLETMKRADAQARVRTLGGTTPSGVSKDLTWLVIGDADLEKFRAGWRSSKLKKAETLRDSGEGPEIIGESRFLALLEVAEA
ncbi:MAG: DNA ligase (NAD(+)) LigA [Deltaproteobacteria bacterium]|nr:MAG: DNA ligase (NAD(+)) LigA [Deltaproteobacteria bacterium]